ncbi:MAG: FAD-dependent oxidoreductase, partial [Deltaproteobacteria bacterium]|nr:FAD-dependent oxidoreductase [Deltaproteobacteria bacterium]
LDRSFQPSDSALMVPRTDDGRVLFMIPWHDKVLVGTTDTEMPSPCEEPRALDEEIDFILANVNRYLAREAQRSDVLSVFAGLRPLVQADPGAETKTISREHAVLVSASGLVTIVGGKWTTYRKMAQDTVDDALAVAGLGARPCPTEALPIHGWMERHHPEFPTLPALQPYGADHAEVRAIEARSPLHAELLHPRLPYRIAHVVYAARNEMARTLEDVLARRTRSLLLDARASIEAAPRTVEILAAELGRSAEWRSAQLHDYEELAHGYLVR